MKSTLDHTAAVELRLYLDNDGTIHRTRTAPVSLNLEKKLSNGTYDHTKAPKAWMHVVDAAARRYTAEFDCLKPTSSFGCFSRMTRESVAKDLADDFLAEYNLQNGIDQ